MPPSTRNVTPGVTDLRPRIASSTRRASSWVRHPNVHHGAALWRDDVWTQASLYGADVHCDSPHRVVEGEERLYQVGELQDEHLLDGTRQPADVTCGLTAPHLLVRIYRMKFAGNVLRFSAPA